MISMLVPHCSIDHHAAPRVLFTFRLLVFESVERTTPVEALSEWAEPSTHLAARCNAF
jgi:hypothetical protein